MACSCWLAFWELVSDNRAGTGTVNAIQMRNRPANTDGAVTLPLHCGSCGLPVTVQYAHFECGAPHEQNHYRCPWCDAENSYRAPGRIVWVVRGHAADEPLRH